MAVAPRIDDKNGGGCGSQFFITLSDNIDYLDGKHAVFGHVVEGLDTLDKLNDVFTDKDGRPLKDVRIRHVEILGESFHHCHISLRLTTSFEHRTLNGVRRPIR